MKNTRTLGTISLLLFLGMISYHVMVSSAIYEQIDINSNTLDFAVNNTIKAPGSFNTSLLEDVTYNPNVRKSMRFNWKIISLEKTIDFHLIEGDKRLKKNDKIILLIGTNPELQLSDVHDWCQIYVNDVMTRYPTESQHTDAAFKYLLPLTLNYSKSASSNYSIGDYFEYLATSPDVNRTIWTVDDKLAVYENTVYTEQGNRTILKIKYDNKTRFMNELNLQAIYTTFVNGTAGTAGANMTMIRLHGFGLRYNITTWVVWIPVILFLTALIVSIRYRVFQRYKIYRESKKLAQRE
ncbi:MAG: hypothetical protein KAS63_07375 [Candidatus Heimdallarchaeota archaeon]|nr:hypothetical protein [Candidatus Heimdallarchaeota archaeon]MCK4955168.1 hypothetical protein [Candidatus Heimdallarchaeota archaeon]